MVVSTEETYYQYADAYQAKLHMESLKKPTEESAEGEGEEEQEEPPEIIDPMFEEIKAVRIQKHTEIAEMNQRLEKTPSITLVLASHTQASLFFWISLYFCAQRAANGLTVALAWLHVIIRII